LRPGAPRARFPGRWAGTAAKGEEEADQDPRHPLRQRRRRPGGVEERCGWPQGEEGRASTTPRRRRGARAQPGRGCPGANGGARDSGSWLARGSLPHLDCGRSFPGKAGMRGAATRSSTASSRGDFGGETARGGGSRSPAARRATRARWRPGGSELGGLSKLVWKGELLRAGRCKSLESGLSAVAEAASARGKGEAAPPVRLTRGVTFPSSCYRI
jgi:hypothetical protein